MDRAKNFPHTLSLRYWYIPQRYQHLTPRFYSMLLLVSLCCAIAALAIWLSLLLLCPLWTHLQDCIVHTGGEAHTIDKPISSLLATHSIFIVLAKSTIPIVNTGFHGMHLTPPTALHKAYSTAPHTPSRRSAHYALHARSP